MAARIPHLVHPVNPVPAADRAIDTHGRIWHCYEVSVDPFASLWETTDGIVGATWARLSSAHSPVLAYRANEWTVTL